MGGRVPASSVRPLLDAVVGETSPVGETYEDEGRMLNVPAFSEVCEWVLGRIDEAQAAAGSPQGSVQELAEAVLDAAGGLALLSDIENGREKAWMLGLYGYVRPGMDEVE